VTTRPIQTWNLTSIKPAIRSRKCFPVSFIICILLLLAGGAQSNTERVDRLLQQSGQLQTQGRQSQERIDLLHDQTRDLFSQFQQENRRLEDLVIYNTQLQRQVEKQQSKIAEIEHTLGEIAMMERQIAPLLLRMINGLEQFIELDMPFLLDERRDRIQALKDMLDRPDVSIAEKFRQVMEAFEIERSYGITLEAWQDTLQFDQPRDVEMLRIGRVALIYSTLDGSAMGVWNSTSRQFEPLDARYRREVRKGLRMARRQQAPELLTLPVLTPAQTEAR
jgi:hypothetical protein